MVVEIFCSGRGSARMNESVDAGKYMVVVMSAYALINVYQTWDLALHCVLNGPTSNMS